MKAKIIETGQLIEVEAAYTPGDRKATGGYFKKGNPRQTYSKFELEFDIHNLRDKRQINWEQRRFELVKGIITGSMADPGVNSCSDQKIIDGAIEFADMIIEKLKHK